MLTRLYVDNYRPFVNFELKTQSLNSLLFIGANGAGKSSILKVLHFFQKIAGGNNPLYSNDDKMKADITDSDFGLMGKNSPMTFELEARIGALDFKYQIVLDYPANFYRPRITDEVLTVGQRKVLTRKLTEITLVRKNSDSVFSLNWHIFALPMIVTDGQDDPVEIFRTWLKKMILIAPVPQFMKDQARKSDGEILELNASNMMSWLSENLSRKPQQYAFIDKYLKETMADFDNFGFLNNGDDSKKFQLNFAKGEIQVSIPWNNASQGEKILFLAAAVYAYAETQTDALVFWDEPDNYISNSLLNCFIRKMRTCFEKHHRQLLVISHNVEIINGFNDQNTFVLRRRGHLDGALPLVTVEELRAQKVFNGYLTDAVLAGDIFDGE